MYQNWPKRPMPFTTQILIKQALLEIKINGCIMQVSTKCRDTSRTLAIKFSSCQIIFCSQGEGKAKFVKDTLGCVSMAIRGSMRLPSTLYCLHVLCGKLFISNNFSPDKFCTKSHMNPLNYPS